MEIAVLKEQQKAQEDIKSKEAEIALLKAAAELDKQNATIQENALKDRYEARLKLKQEEVDYYKDLKARMSTKMIGETLEIHCSTQFNQMLRPMMHREVRKGTLSFVISAKMGLNTYPSCSR